MRRLPRRGIAAGLGDRGLGFLRGAVALDHRRQAGNGARWSRRSGSVKHRIGRAVCLGFECVIGRADTLRLRVAAGRGALLHHMREFVRQQALAFHRMRRIAAGSERALMQPLDGKRIAHGFCSDGEGKIGHRLVVKCRNRPGVAGRDMRLAFGRAQVYCGFSAGSPTCARPIRQLPSCQPGRAVCKSARTTSAANKR